jgi:predicted nucleotidyltransferase
MMQKLWLKKLKLNYSKDVFDIVQFGSSVMENSSPNDIDVAVIFQKIPLKNQLNQAQEIKKQLQKESSIPVHVKSFDLYSFFDEANFAKEGILFYGKSLVYKDYFVKRFGFSPKIQISYSLEKLEKKGKVRFHYMLKGKKGEYGLLKKYGGELLKPGLVEIYPEYEGIFITSIKKIISDFKSKKILY